MRGEYRRGRKSSLSELLCTIVGGFMETVITFFLIVIVILQMIQLFISSGIKNKTHSVVLNQESILLRFSQIADAIIQIADAKRVMEVIKLVGKEDLGFTIKDFEPRKDIILESMLELLKDEKLRQQYKKDADTLAFCIISRSGFAQFVKYSSDFKKPLAKLLVNRDYKGAERLIKKMVNAL
jgi:hypothetical protein